MPRVPAITSAADVAPPHRAVADAVTRVFGSIGGKRDPSGLPDDEREVMTYARQLMRTNRPDPALFEALAQRHGAEWMVELTATVHYFALVAGVANAFDIAPPAGGDTLPA